MIAESKMPSKDSKASWTIDTVSVSIQRLLSRNKGAGDTGSLDAG